MAARKNSPLSGVTKTDVEKAVADALLGDPTAANAITAKASAASKQRVSKAMAAAKAPAAKPRAAAKATEVVVETPDLTKALLDGLRAEGVAAEAVVSPKGNFYRLVVDGTTIGFVNYRAKGALRIEPKLEGGRAPKGFVAQAKVRNGLGYVGTFADEKSIALAVSALATASAKLDAGKAA